MAISATIDVADMAAANADLEGLGYGVGNFSVPLGAADTAQLAGLHLGGRDDKFLADLRGLAYASVDILSGDSSNNFSAATRGVGRPDTTETEYPARGDIQLDGDGNEWVSLVDDNVWPIPIGWRKNVANPEWIQPVGAIDAYPIGATVTYGGSEYTSTIGSNVWSPDVYGWESTAGGEWAAGTAYSIGDVATYQGGAYECIQAHTAQTGWEPPNVPALWSAR